MLSRADLLGAPIDDDVDGRLKPTKSRNCKQKGVGGKE